MGQGWHLWVLRSPSTVLFTLSTSRSALVPEAHFGAEVAGILLSDRAALQEDCPTRSEGLKLGLLLGPRAPGLLLLGQPWPEWEGWAMSWVQGIGGLFDLNRRRLQVRTAARILLPGRDQQLRGALWGPQRQREAQLGSPALHRPAKRCC